MAKKHKNRKIRARDESHARRLCLAGHTNVYLDGVQYEFTVREPDPVADLLAEVRDQQAEVPVEEQVRRVVK